MSASVESIPERNCESRLPGGGFQYFWVHVVIAALAMVATLPGRTQGLGLITKPLMADFHLSELQYGEINTWATLLGALFCLPCGWLLDRFGPRAVLAAVMLPLGFVVLLMSRIQPHWRVVSLSLPWLTSSVPFTMGLFLLILLTRGLGQSALSVVSLGLMGKSTGRRVGLAYGLYSIAISLGFMCAFGACFAAMEYGQADWRDLWGSMGWILLLGAVTLPWLVRSSVLMAGTRDQAAVDRLALDPHDGLTLGAALRTSTFWVFALAASLYIAISSGIFLFNQGILEDRGFDQRVFLIVMTMMPLTGLAGNLATGWLSRRWPLGRLLAVAMIALGADLCLFPLVHNLVQLCIYAATLGIVGGMITVLFFGVWGKAFGAGHLGKIQGAAQILTVLASALGPLLFAYGKQTCQSYIPVFYALAPICGLFGIMAWFTPAGERLR